MRRKAAEFFDHISMWCGTKGWRLEPTTGVVGCQAYRSVKAPGVLAAFCRIAFEVASAAMRACMEDL